MFAFQLELLRLNGEGWELRQDVERMNRWIIPLLFIPSLSFAEFRLTSTNDASGTTLFLIDANGATSTTQPIVISSKTADQVTTTSVATPVLFESNVKNSNITHANSGSSTFTFVSSGTYYIACHLQYDANIVGFRQVTMLVNNTNTILNTKNNTAAPAPAARYFTLLS